ncbi:MAG: macrolide ABC transporter ATP-binding protein [Chloroflexota bacterium]|nr:MAG: macrolide ABC transporter ATP-binding protein [Chloroflexota bacterium]
MIGLEDIHKSFTLGTVIVEVLTGLDLTIEKGTLIAVVGQSGCGKSTLLNTIGLLDKPTSGKYHLEGRDVGKLSDDELSEIRNKKIGFVFQQFNLLARLTALDNVALPLIYRGLSESRRKKMARRMLEKVGMLDREDHRPSQLSGGQQQRVAIARALVGQPAIILADEPTGALDAQVSNDIMDLFIQLNSEEQVTIFIITHDMEVARRCHRYVRMENGAIHA